jgi:hypothetical protein
MQRENKKEKPRRSPETFEVFLFYFLAASRLPISDSQQPTKISSQQKSLPVTEGFSFR